MITNVYWSHVRYRLFLLDFKETRVFSKEFRKILKYQMSQKSLKWEPSCCMPTDRQTTKLILTFRNFVSTPKKKKPGFYNMEL
jgi:hypothetical protein